MIISFISGGLGNQMFQYAAGRALALKLGCEVKLDVSFYRMFKTNRRFELSDVFDHDFKIANDKELRSVLGWKLFLHRNKKLRHWIRRMPFNTNWILEKDFAYWPRLRMLKGSCFLEGNWQSEKYFADFSDEIQKDFSFKMKNFPGESMALKRKMQTENSVSIHIRRGDYAANKETLQYHGICPAGYYQQAIQIMREKLDQPVFFVFSDEIQTAKDLLGTQKNVYFVEENFQGNNHFDMMLMSQCRHNVIANSTFSWWGAWLNRNKAKIVIAPKIWFAGDLSSDDLIPQTWIRI